MPVAFTVELGYIRMMRESVNEGDDARGVGKDLVPFLESAVGSHNHGTAFVTTVDDFVEQVGGFVIEGKITYLIDSQ